MNQAAKIRTSKRRRVVLFAMIALGLLAAALMALQNEISHLTVASIAAEFRTLAPLQIVLALLGACANFLALIGHDLIALKYAGRTLGFRKAAFASFSANALANTIGFGFVTGSAVRYRMYGSWGLNAEEIGVVGAVTGINVVLGAAALSGAGLLAEAPFFSEMIGINSALLRGFGFLLLLAPFYFLAWSFRGGSDLKIGALSIKHPPPRRVIMQLCVTLIDWAGAALVLYALLPDATPIGYVAFLPVFVIANLLGAASGLPGGVGVFEAAIILIMPTGGESGAVAALFGYRIIYYLVPLLIAGVALAVREAREQKVKITSGLTIAGDVTTGMAPPLFALLSFLSGVILLWSAAVPAMPSRVLAVNTFLPLAVIETSHFLSSVVGILLILIAMGLRRRLRPARVAALILLALGGVTSLLKGADFEEAIILTIVFLSLLFSKRAFTREGGVSAFKGSYGWLIAAFAAIGATTWIGFFSYHQVEYSNDLWWTFLRDSDSSRFLRSITGASIALVCIVIWRLFGRPLVPATSNNFIEMEKAAEIINRAEAAHTDANLALLGDKQFLFSTSGDSFLMYAARGRNLIAMGEPAGRQNEFRDLAWSFRERADQLGLVPVFYSARKEFLPTLIDAGFAIQKIGETALISLKDFSLDGPTKSKMRNAQRRLGKEGMNFEVLKPEEVAANIPQLKIISDQWLARHHGVEKSFTLGRFDPAYIVRFLCAIIRRGEEILAFANLWETSNKTEVSIDLMRYGDASPNGTMDGLFVELIMWAKAQGYGNLDLGMAPLAGLEGRRLTPFFTRLGAFIFQHGDALYGFEGLRQYKDKYDPVWEPVYIAAPGMSLIPVALGDVALLTSGGLLGLLK